MEKRELEGGEGTNGARARNVTATLDNSPENLTFGRCAPYVPRADDPEPSILEPSSCCLLLACLPVCLPASTGRAAVVKEEGEEAKEGG
jgi:hypothetical protein